MYFVSSGNSSGSYWLLYHALPSPLHSLDKVYKREREIERVDMIMKVQGITKHFFMTGKQNISSLPKVIYSLVSLFLLCIMKVVDQS